MFGSETSKYDFTVMNLVDESFMYRVQNNLAEARKNRASYGAVWFNIIVFLVIAGLAAFFLVSQYHSTKEVLQAKESRKDIPRMDMFWNNSIRNSIEL